MQLRTITRGLHEASHLWDYAENDEVGGRDVHDSGAVMCTSPLHDELAAAALFKDLSDPASVSCRAVCRVCDRVFPSEHFLQLHITESHDAIFRSKVEQKEKVFSCLVSGCKKRFKARNERKQHLQAAHGYSKEFNFDKMHLQQIKSRKTNPAGAADGDDMSDDDESEVPHVGTKQPVHAVEVHEAAEAQQHPESSMQEDALSSAMANLSTAHFVPRAVHMRGAKR